MHPIFVLFDPSIILGLFLLELSDREDAISPCMIQLASLASCLGHDQILVLRRGGHYQDKNAPAGVKMKQLVQVVRTDIL